MKRIVLLGATGSIGASTLDIISRFPDRLELIGISAYVQEQSLTNIVSRFPSCRWAVLLGRSPSIDRIGKTTFLYGQAALLDALRDYPPDIVVFAMPGGGVMELFFSILKLGLPIAMANKECLVMGLDLLMPAVRRNILPIDSEQSAIWQILPDRISDVKRVVLTCSGGPFFGKGRDFLRDVSPEMALRHPRWQMGKKVSLDSATLMNKALEMIEARALFGFDIDKISVLIHPQAHSHSMLELIDGSILVQAGITDMRLPIQYALSFPERWENPDLSFAGLDNGFSWDFYPPDRATFSSLDTAILAMEKGGSALAVFNTANDILGELFLDGKIGFLDIMDINYRLVDRHVPWRVEEVEDIKRAIDWTKAELYKEAGLG